MKRLTLILSIILIIGGIFYLLLFAPFHFYRSVLGNGVQSQFLNIEKLPNSYFLSSKKEAKLSEGTFFIDKSRWERIHFKNFSFVVPYRNPMFKLVPIFFPEEPKHKLGIKLQNPHDFEINTLKILDQENFEIEFQQHLLFKLPIFKNNILSRPVSQIWKDIFTLDIGNISSSNFEFPNLDEYEKSFKNLVYELFILDLRKKYFPDNSLTFSLHGNIGIVTIIDKETSLGLAGQYREEIYFFLDNNQIHKIKFRTRRGDLKSEVYREKLLSSIKLKFSKEEYSIPFYSRFKNLDYYEKTDPASLIFLLCAYSHEDYKRGYLKDLIYWLERGGADLSYLTPIYEFSYDKFGTTLSNIKSRLKETEREKLKRKINIENKDYFNILNSRLPSSDEDNFDSSAKKIDYYLNKAKNKGFDSDRNQQMLIVD